MSIESEEEFLDLELSEHLRATEVGTRLDAELPRGFCVQWAEAIDLRAPSIDASINGLRYAVAVDSLPPDKQTPAFLATSLNKYLMAASVPLRKHTRNGEKIVDAKQFVERVALATPATVQLELRVTAAGTIKPHEFAGTLFGLTSEEAKILRLTKIQTLFHAPSTLKLPDEHAQGVDTPLEHAAI